jgi:hypothetical protein
MNNNFYGMWIGTVEDRNDPLKLRCRVRILGVHPESRAQVPTEALPWASISCPPSSMLSQMMPKEGDMVDGYFMQGNPDFPVVTGVIHGIRLEDQNRSIGFNDPRTKAQIDAAPKTGGDVVYPGRALGAPSLPYVGLENLTLLKQTTIHRANQNRKHVCDVAGLMKRSAALARLKFSEIMDSIRTAIKAVLKALGLTPSGETSYWIEQAKKLARELKDIARKISEIADLVTVIVDFAKRVRAMIDFILGLPAKLYALLKQCLAELIASLTSGFTELFSLSGKTDFSEAIAVFNDIKKSAGEVYTAGLKIVAAPVAIVEALTTPASASGVAAAGETLTTYLSTVNPTSTTTDFTKFTTN